MSLRELLYDYGGGTLSAVGPFARCRWAVRSGPIGRESRFDTPLDYEMFAAAGGMLGHGGIVVFDDTRGHGCPGPIRNGILCDRVLWQMHPLSHRLDPRRGGD